LLGVVCWTFEARRRGGEGLNWDRRGILKVVVRALRSISGEARSTGESGGKKGGHFKQKAVWELGFTNKRSEKSLKGGNAGNRQKRRPKRKRIFKTKRLPQCE